MKVERRARVELLNALGEPVGEPVDAMGLARPFLEQLAGHELEVGEATLLMYAEPAPPDPAAFDLPAYRSSLWGWARAVILSGDELLYYHPHTLEEVMAPGLRRLLTGLPEGLVAGWRLAGPSFAGTEARPVPTVFGAVAALPHDPSRPRPFRLRRVPPPPPPVARASDLGAGPLPLDWASASRTERVRIVVDEEVHQDLMARRRWDPEVEEGGFLLGRVYEDADAPGRYLLRLTAAPAAQVTGASYFSFTFTGDSFVAINEEITRRALGEELLGWYHSHLFGSHGDLGLSSIDLRLHAETFRLPWQVAGLVNLGREGRVLRFYAREGAGMSLCHHEVVARRSDAGP